ncbi:MAG: hypothetical protein IH613_07670 [Desulfuromonadales bacterium]|nr:hypothetical protein [Desulfuromonadales bacterium]
MKISEILKDGKERDVSKDELKYLMVTQQILFFKWSDGWVVIGRDEMRDQMSLYNGVDRREHQIFAHNYRFW